MNAAREFLDARREFCPPVLEIFKWDGEIPECDGWGVIVKDHDGRIRSFVHGVESSAENGWGLDPALADRCPCKNRRP